MGGGGFSDHFYKAVDFNRMKVTDNVWTRNEIIDAIKAFAIICVIFGHCIQYGSGYQYQDNCSFFENSFFKAIYSFHMPLFMLLSGYLFGNSVRKRKWYQNIFKRSRSLVIPILIWSVLQSFIICFLSYNVSLTVPEIGHFIKVYINSILTSLWFLWAVFYCSAIVAVVSHFLNDNIIVYFLGLVMTFFLPDVLCLNLYKFMYPFFIIGYIYKSKHLSTISFLSNSRKTMLAFFLAYIVLFSFYNRDSYIYTTGYTILRDSSISIWQFSIDIYRFSIGFIGSLIVILFFLNTYTHFPKSLKMTLLYLGRNTLGIYIIQGFIVAYFLPFFTKDFSGFNILIAFMECVVVLLVTLIVLEIIKLSKMSRKLMLGLQS